MGYSAAPKGNYYQRVDAKLSIPTHSANKKGYRCCITRAAAAAAAAAYSSYEKMAGGNRGGEGCTQLVHSRSRMAIEPRIPTMPGRSTSGFHQPGRHCVHREVLGESHEG